MNNGESDAEALMLLQYMDDIKCEVLGRLTPLEIAAVYNHYDDFCFEYRQDCAQKFVEYNLD